MKFCRRNFTRQCTIGIAVCLFILIYLFDESPNRIDEKFLEYYNFNDDVRLRDEDFEGTDADINHVSNIYRRNVSRNVVTSQYGGKLRREDLIKYITEEPDSSFDNVEEEMRRNNNSSKSSIGTNCSSAYAPNALIDSEFHETNASQWVFLYSAYYDPSESAVSVIAIVHINGYHSNRNKLFCKVYLHGNASKATEASVRLIYEKDSSLFRDAIITCSLEKGETPKYVSIATDPCQDVGMAWKVGTQDSSPSHKKLFTICASFGDSFYDFQELREFVESHRMFGVERFLIYGNRMSRYVERYLEYYKSKGIVEYRQWKMPRTVSKYSKFQGKFSAYNDCLFRHRTSSDFMAFLNLNEILVPADGSLKRTLEKYPDGACAYLVQTATYWRNAMLKINTTYELFGAKLLTHTTRNKTIKSHDSGSRYIARPLNTNLAGISKPIRCNQSKNTIMIDKKLMLTHIQDSKVEKTPRRSTLVDKQMSPYANELISRLMDVSQKVNSFQMVTRADAKTGEVS